MEGTSKAKPTAPAASSLPEPSRTTSPQPSALSPPASPVRSRLVPKGRSPTSSVRDEPESRSSPASSPRTSSIFPRERPDVSPSSSLHSGSLDGLPSSLPKNRYLQRERSDPSPSSSLREEITSSPQPSKISDKRTSQVSLGAGVQAPKARASQESLGSGRPSGLPNVPIGPSKSPIPFPTEVSSSSPSPQIDGRAPMHERRPTHERTSTQERVASHERSPSTPRPRIPSTGSRATVMDVAETFSRIMEKDETKPPELSSGAPQNDAPTSATPLEVETPPPSSPEEPIPAATVPVQLEEPKSPVTPARPRTTAPGISKRMSSYDRYSIALPPLEEEQTPTTSPAGSFKSTPKRPSVIEEGTGSHILDGQSIHSRLVSSSDDQHFGMWSLEET